MPQQRDSKDPLEDEKLLKLYWGQAHFLGPLNPISCGIITIDQPPSPEPGQPKPRPRISVVFNIALGGFELPKSPLKMGESPETAARHAIEWETGVKAELKDNRGNLTQEGKELIHRFASFFIGHDNIISIRDNSSVFLGAVSCFKDIHDGTAVGEHCTLYFAGHPGNVTRVEERVKPMTYRYMTRVGGKIIVNAHTIDAEWVPLPGPRTPKMQDYWVDAHDVVLCNPAEQALKTEVLKYFDGGGD